MKSSRKLHTIQISVLSFLLLLGFLIMAGTLRGADRQIQSIRNTLFSRMEKDYGISIQYKKISPALLSAVRIENLRIDFDGGYFFIERLRVFYNPFLVFRKKSINPLNFIYRISASDGQFRYDKTEVTNSEKKRVANSLDPWELLENKSVDLNRMSASIKFNDNTEIETDNFELLLEDDKDTVRYSLEGEFNFLGGELSDRITRITSNLQSTGNFDPQGNAVNGRTNIQSIQTSRWTISPQSLDFTYAENELTVRRINDRRPMSIRILYDGSIWNIETEYEGLKISDLAKPIFLSREGELALETEISGNASFSYNTSQKEINYNVNLSMETALKDDKSIQTRIAVSGSEKRMDARQIEISLPWGNISYRGFYRTNPMKAEGEFILKIHEEASAGPLLSVLDVATQDGIITVSQNLERSSDIAFENFRILIIPEGGKYTLSLIAEPKGYSENARGRIVLDSNLDFQGISMLRGFLNVDGVRVRDLGRVFGLRGGIWKKIFSDSIVNMSGYFGFGRESWLVTIDHSEILSRKKPENSILLKGRISPNQWAVDTFSLSWNGYKINSSAFAEKNADGGGNADIQMIAGEFFYPLTVEWTPKGAVQLKSNFGLSVELGEKELPNRAIFIQGRDFKFPLQDGLLTANIDIRGQSNASDWNLAINKGQIKQIRKEGSVSFIDFSGTLNPRRVLFPLIRYTDSEGELTGSVRYGTEENNQENIEGQLVLISQDGEFYDVSFSRVSGYWDASARIKDSSLSRIFSKQIRGKMNLEGRLEGYIENPSLDLDIQTEDGFLNDEPFELKGSALMNSGKLRIENVNITRSDISLKNGLSFFDFEKKTVKSTGEIEGEYNQTSFSTGFSASFDFDESLPSFNLASIMETPFRGVFITEEFFWDNEIHFPSFTFQASSDSNALQIQTPEEDVLDINYGFKDGRFDVSIGDPFPLTVQGGGTFLRQQIDADFPIFRIDPVLINYIMFRDPLLLQYSVIFQSGELGGKLAVKGHVENPSFYGDIQAVNLKIDTPYTYASIKPVSMDIRFRGNRIEIDPMEVSIGNGTAYGNGYLVLDAWKLSEMNLHFGVRGEKNTGGVPVYYPLFAINLDGLIAGEFDLIGDSRNITFKGYIQIPDMNFSLGSLRTARKIKEKNGQRNVFVDLTLITGRNCNIFLPNEQLYFFKAAAEEDQKLRLTYTNRPKAFSFVGDVPLKTGEIIYFDKSFQLTEGTISFNEFLESFDPLLLMRAEARVQDEDGEEVDVALVYNAPILSDFNPTIETVPPRLDEEILALFGRAAIPYAEGDGGTSTSSMIKAVSGAIGRIGIVQPFENLIKRSLNLDMVTIQTDIIENALEEGLIGNQDNLVSAEESGLGRLLDNTSVFAGKFIDKSLFISGQLTAKYLGQEGQNPVLGSLGFQPTISLELATPFLKVAWLYAPDFPVDNFVASSKISLNWKISF